jgi:hypothetical protein
MLQSARTRMLSEWRVCRSNCVGDESVWKGDLRSLQCVVIPTVDTQMSLLQSKSVQDAMWCSLKVKCSQ